MNTDERVMAAKDDKKVREELIREYHNFIISVCSKTAGRFIPDDSDTASSAMLAFDEAISKYDVEKGGFVSFAAGIIKNRVIDRMRAEKRDKNTVPFSALSGENDNGDEVPFEVEDSRAEITDSAIEITLLKDELSEYDISFFDLPDFSPKSFKTKRSCQNVVCHIMDKQLL